MIERPQIAIHNRTGWHGHTHFKIQMLAPGEIAAMIAEHLDLGDCAPVSQLAVAMKCFISVSDFEFQNEELLWADLYIDHVPTSFMRNDDGSYLMTMVFEKEPEGDDRLDQFAFERKMENRLPDNFWIEPANLIRKLIAATKH